MTWLRLLLAALVVLVVLAAPARAEGAKPLVLATTTSVRDTGLMDWLLPLFEKASGIHVQLIAVGSGAALAMGEKGDADLLLTHDPDGEQALVEKGALIDHRPILQNFYVIAGPDEDPAGIRNAKDAVAALQRLAAAAAPYVSRGDDSGTHRREQSLLAKAGLDPNPSWKGFLRTGLGMGATLQVAGEKRAYALSDHGTLRSFAAATRLVAVLDSRTPELRNVYSLSRPNPERLPAGRVDVARARELFAFFVAPATLARITAFGKEGGEPLFQPIAAGLAE